MNKWTLALLVIIGLASCKSGTYDQGKRLYTTKCANCHMPDGSGLEGVIPPLAASDFLQNNQSNLVCIIRKGIEGPIMVNNRKYDNKMAGIDINDVQLTNIINYINTAWGNEYGEVTLDEVKKQCSDK